MLIFKTINSVLLWYPFVLASLLWVCVLLWFVCEAELVVLSSALALCRLTVT